MIPEEMTPLVSPMEPGRDVCASGPSRRGAWLSRSSWPLPPYLPCLFRLRRRTKTLMRPRSTDPRAETQIARAAGATEGAQVVPLDWSLIPDGLGLGAGDEFRLLFLSSTVRDATSNRIVPYNSFIQDLAAAGHADVQAYSSGFRVVGCTFTIDARDNTKTTYTDSDKGVPIYWLGVDRKVADDYQDFYDWTWTNESRNRNEFGSGNRDTAQSENQPFTGCNHDGTGITSGTFKTLGAASGRVQTGRPANPTSGVGPIDGDLSHPRCQLAPLLRALGGLPRGLPRRDAERSGRAERCGHRRRHYSRQLPAVSDV